MPISTSEVRTSYRSEYHSLHILAGFEGRALEIYPKMDAVQEARKLIGSE